MRLPLSVHTIFCGDANFNVFDPSAVIAQQKLVFWKLCLEYTRLRLCFLRAVSFLARMSNVCFPPSVGLHFHSSLHVAVPNNSNQVFVSNWYLFCPSEASTSAKCMCCRSIKQVLARPEFYWWCANKRLHRSALDLQLWLRSLPFFIEATRRCPNASL